jgi:putative FmdB family regulatory protein
MPLYEYKCGSCGEVFEVRQKFADEPLVEHPGCGGKVERLISASSLHFKGSGWYVTDYGRNGSVHDSKSKHKSESTEAAKAETAKTPAPAPAVSKESGKE